MTEKYNIVTHMSEEMWLDGLAMRYGGDFCRKIASRTETPPSEEEWAEYREGVALLEKLRANRYFDEGGDEYGASIEEPQPKVHIEYAETEEEYAARVLALDPNDYEPLMSRLMRLSMSAFAEESNQ